MQEVIHGGFFFTLAVVSAYEDQFNTDVKISRGELQSINVIFSVFTEKI